MGASFGGSKKHRGVDVHLNVVPFIDLMSCLTAFLLATAVWSSHSQVSPQGVGRGGTPSDEVELVASVLISDDALWFGTTTGQLTRLERSSAGHDWKGLGDSLVATEGMHRLEIAAEDTVRYQDIVSAMDVARHKQKQRFSILSPSELTVRFRE